jgi:hypothetical protein
MVWLRKIAAHAADFKGHPGSQYRDNAWVKPVLNSLGRSI